MPITMFCHGNYAVKMVPKRLERCCFRYSAPPTAPPPAPIVVLARRRVNCSVIHHERLVLWRDLDGLAGLHSSSCCALYAVNCEQNFETGQYDSQRTRTPGRRTISCLLILSPDMFSVTHMTALSWLSSTRSADLRPSFITA